MRKAAREVESDEGVLRPKHREQVPETGICPDGLSLKLTVGGVSLYAVEHPWKGATITLESYTARTTTQYSVACPTKCSTEQIAGLIYMNVAQNFRHSAEAFKEHFKKFGIPLFQ